MQYLQLKHPSSNRRVKIISLAQKKQYEILIKSLDLDENTLVYLTSRRKPFINDTKRCPIKSIASIDKWAVRDGDFYIGTFHSKLEAATLVEYLERA